MQSRATLQNFSQESRPERETVDNLLVCHTPSEIAAVNPFFMKRRAYNESSKSTRILLSHKGILDGSSNLSSRLALESVLPVSLILRSLSLYLFILNLLASLFFFFSVSKSWKLVEEQGVALTPTHASNHE